MLIMLSTIHMIKIVPSAVEYWGSNLRVILYLLQYPLTTCYYPSSNTEQITHCLILVSESYEEHFHSFQRHNFHKTLIHSSISGLVFIVIIVFKTILGANRNHYNNISRSSSA